MAYLSFVDIVLSGCAMGATIWVFFLQSPLLIKIMGRDRFVPIMMKLTMLLFASLTVVTAIVVVLALVGGASLFSLAFLGALGGLAGAAINHFVFVPRALIAGGKGRMEEKDPDQNKSVQTFAVEGAGPSAQGMHLTAVFIVVLMLGGLGLHLFAM